MKIALASDHRGIAQILAIRDHLEAHGHEAVILGECSGEPCDYPDNASLVGHAVRDGDARFGVLVCGSGIGMSMAANKVRGVRAALACDETAAEMSRRHNDANVLCLAADRAEVPGLLRIADAFLAAEFEGGRHGRRVEKITAIERGELGAKTCP